MEAEQAGSENGGQFAKLFAGIGHRWIRKSRHGAPWEVVSPSDLRLATGGCLEWKILYMLITRSQLEVFGEL
jgi:hypothetical protein